MDGPLAGLNAPLRVPETMVSRPPPREQDSDYLHVAVPEGRWELGRERKRIGGRRKRRRGVRRGIRREGEYRGGKEIEGRMVNK